MTTYELLTHIVQMLKDNYYFGKLLDEWHVPLNKEFTIFFIAFLFILLLPGVTCGARLDKV